MLTTKSTRLLNTTSALTLLAQFNTAMDEHAIVVLLRALCQEMGFDHFRLVCVFPSSIQRPEVRIFNGCPAPWGQTYHERGFFAVDPVIRKGMTQSTPILWANLISECCEQLDADGLEVMLQARGAGLQDGITIPWHGANGHVGLLSFITREPRSESQWLTAAPLLNWLTGHVFEAVARVCLSGMFPREALSQRELEICQWAAEGKRAGDIAQILGITSRTVSFHLACVVKKLGASSKNQAISWALKQGLIRLSIDAARVVQIDERESPQVSND